MKYYTGIYIGIVGNLLIHRMLKAILIKSTMPLTINSFRPILLQTYTSQNPVDLFEDQVKIIQTVKIFSVLKRYRQLTGMTPTSQYDLMSNLNGNSSSKCFPKKQLAFAKTHKTGSSTLQNIFFR